MPSTPQNGGLQTYTEDFVSSLRTFNREETPKNSRFPGAARCNELLRSEEVFSSNCQGGEGFDGLTLRSVALGPWLASNQENR